MGTAPRTLESARQWYAFAFQAWQSPGTRPPDSPLDAGVVRRLGIAPLLYRALHAARDDRAARFVVEYRHTATVNLIRLTQSARVRDALEAQGITPILIKGGAFLLRFCSDTLGVRPMSDLDVLVAPERYEAARAVMLDCGFQPAPGTTSFAAPLKHAVSFVSTAGPTPLDIDLHRDVAQWPVAAGLAPRMVADHERIQSWRIPRLADAFCLTALHRARHGFGWSALDLVEIKRTAQALTDDEWLEVVDRSARLRFAGAVWVSYRQAVWWLGAEPPDEARLAQIAERIGSATRHLLERMAPPEEALEPDARWRRPLIRNFVVGPCAMTTPARAIAGAALFFPLRAAEEWTHAGQQGLGPAERVRRLWGYLKAGSDSQGIAGAMGDAPGERPTCNTR